MGITARGAWESVKRHLRELGVDPQTQDITVVGIGDMSGDVFGNGMLLSHRIRLVAAFDHRHIFLDPSPDPAVSYVERQRLFDLPGSSWDDYDRSLLSAGGGVWPRTAKSVPISPQVHAALGLDRPVTALTPVELVRAILTAPVHLLFNGGIGTYVKASGELTGHVGDRANDQVRVNGAQLRCRVVGEGGNLGLTQAGRVEYAQHGGRVNADFVDNSAGVDCSDHEVNIKILLALGSPTGEPDRDGRTALLARMTTEVAGFVLANSYRQAGLLGDAGARAAADLAVHRRMLSELEHSGRLDRVLEGLPDDEALAARAAAGTGLTAPELAVLVAYTRLAIRRELAGSTVCDEPWTGTVLADYFPTPLRQRYATRMADHPLRREIVATQLVNEVVGRGGESFVFRAVEETGAGTTDVLRGYAVVRDVFGLPEVWASVEALDGVVPIDIQASAYVDARQLLDRAVRWLLAHRRSPIDVSGEIARIRPGIRQLLPQLSSVLRGGEQQALMDRHSALVEQGVPAGTADLITQLRHGPGLLDVVETAHSTRRDLGEVADVYFVLSDRFQV
jgi:glutamate dehydrogenase